MKGGIVKHCYLRLSYERNLSILIIWQKATVTNVALVSKVFKVELSEVCGVCVFLWAFNLQTSELQAVKTHHHNLQVVSIETHPSLKVW